ncbi:MAG: hypothetical protein ACQKBU_05440 [Verrucomicrobiales bacterium]
MGEVRDKSKELEFGFVGIPIADSLLGMLNSKGKSVRADVVNWIVGGWLIGCLTGWLMAQEIPEVVVPKASEGDLARLVELAPALSLAREDLETARDTLEKARTEEERKELAEDYNEQRVRVEKLRDDFRALASGIEEDTYLGVEPESVGLQQTLESILEPISRAVRELTQEPREMDELKRKLTVTDGHVEMSLEALGRLEKLLQLAQSEAIREELTATRELWDKRLAQAQSQKAVFEQQIQIREGDQRSTLEKLSEFFQSFWKSRGLNLLMAVIGAVGSFMLVKRGFRVAKRFRRVKAGKQAGTASRTMDLAAEFAAVLVAIGVVVLVFYLRGDWLMLALAILAILGVLWASKNALPPYIEQLRLILNLGSVREGERLVFNGVPWRVKKLNFHCFFDNPDLEGGGLRLPIRDVMPLHSRAADPAEPWFPTRKDDWVVLEDETYGKVIEQSPEQVVVLRLGGSRKTYTVSDYLALAPENLSGGFRVQSTFGIDYDHQSISIDRVPAIFRQAVESALYEKFGHALVRSVKTEFSRAGASSLDYVIIADFDGELGARKNVIERLIQSVCVQVCNQQGWGIPFQQITLHRAEAEA